MQLTPVEWVPSQSEVVGWGLRGVSVVDTRINKGTFCFGYGWMGHHKFGSRNHRELILWRRIIVMKKKILENNILYLQIII